MHAVRQVGDWFANDGRRRGIDVAVGGQGDAAIGVVEQATDGIPQLSSAEESDLARIESRRISRQAVKPVQLETPGGGASTRQIPTARETGVGAGVSHMVIGVVREVG